MQHIDSILAEVKHLNKDEQLILFEKLVAIIRREQKVAEVKLSSISGVGADIWKGTDIDKYLERTYVP